MIITTLPDRWTLEVEVYDGAGAVVCRHHGLTDATFRFTLQPQKRPRLFWLRKYVYDAYWHDGATFEARYRDVYDAIRLGWEYVERERARVAAEVDVANEVYAEAQSVGRMIQEANRVLDA